LPVEHIVTQATFDFLTFALVRVTLPICVGNTITILLFSSIPRNSQATPLTIETVRIASDVIDENATLYIAS
jgi:hypothetical protein